MQQLAPPKPATDLVTELRGIRDSLAKTPRNIPLERAASCRPCLAASE
jgi:hypothetical protein